MTEPKVTFPPVVCQESKICEWFGVEFFRPADHLIGRWEKRRFCGKPCAIRSRHSRLVLKKCKCCGGTIIPREGQSPSNYRRQIYCSTSCSSKHTKSGNKYKNGAKHLNWSGGVTTNSAGYATIMTENGKYRPIHIVLMEWYLCRRLQNDECVHHCNKNKKDNRLDNLELMTKSDHSRLHCGHFHSKESTKKAVLSRKGRFKKETHSCWKSEVTETAILSAISSSETLKEAAKKLGICADTLRARRNYIESKKENRC